MRSGCVLTETKIEGSSLRFCVFRPVFVEVEALPGRPVKRQILVSWPWAMLFRNAAFLRQAEGSARVNSLSRLIVSPQWFEMLGADPSLSLRAKSLFRALGLRTTRSLDSMDVLFVRWYLGGKYGRNWT